MQDAKYLHSSDLVTTDLGDEIVLLNPINRKVFSLNKTGQIVWKLLPEGMEAVVEEISRRFGITTEQARGDAEILVADLLENGLVEKV